MIIERLKGVYRPKIIESAHEDAINTILSQGKYSDKSKIPMSILKKYTDDELKNVKIPDYIQGGTHIVINSELMPILKKKLVGIVREDLTWFNVLQMKNKLKAPIVFWS